MAIESVLPNCCQRQFRFQEDQQKCANRRRKPAQLFNDKLLKGLNHRGDLLPGKTALLDAVRGI